MAIFNSLTFDGVDSLEHGVYITGSAAYNAPEREIEMIPIPGRNGSLAIDNGRFENIIVTYPAGIFADNQVEFAEKMRDFRNILVSRYSYVRITDTYNPDEFRVGLYRAGLEVEPTRYNSAAEFEIVFECKPQRFLTSGDEVLNIQYEADYLTDHNLEPIETHSGDKIETGYRDATFSNPTQFESKPMIIVPSNGGINLNGSIISIEGVGPFPIYIDTEMGAIYTEDDEGNKSNASNRVSFENYKFPTILPGENTLESDIEGIEIVPRWWIL